MKTITMESTRLINPGVKMVTSLDEERGNELTDKKFLDDGAELSQICHGTQGKSHLSFWIIAWCCLIGDSSRGLMMPILWSFVSSLGGDLIDQGVVVACFSLGRIITSPIFGAWADKYGYRFVLIVANVMIIVGALLYSQSDSLFWLVVSQLTIGNPIFINRRSRIHINRRHRLGCGAGTLGVTRSYVAENSSKKDRTVKIALLTAMQYAGFTVTPLLGSLFGYIGSQCQPSETGIFEINEYNFAAYFLCVLAFVEIVMLALVFDEQIRDDGKNTTQPLSLPATQPLDYEALLLSVFGCFLNFSTKGTIAVFETMVTQIASTTLQWGFAQRLQLHLIPRFR